MALRAGDRVAVVGAGPGGLLAAKHAIEAGLEPTVLEASDDLGGQWHTKAPHSGIWPGMRTNTSRAMTSFSDFDVPTDHPLHPTATQQHAYLRAYADHFGVTERIRFHAGVEQVSRGSDGWLVDGEPYDGLVLSTGRFRRPFVPDPPPGLETFPGVVMTAFDYPGAAAFEGRRVLVHGNGVSGLEVAADLASVTDVVSAFRKMRYVIEKVVDGVSSDWQWYTYFGALERRHLPPAEFGRRIRDRVLRVAGNPAAYGAPEPDPDLLVAGLSLCQGYLDHIAAGRIVARPGLASVQGSDVTFTDGSTEPVDAIIHATGYLADVPYLDDELRDLLVAGRSELDLYQRTLHPDLRDFGAIGQYPLQGPYWPLLELQARWVVGTLSGALARPSAEHMREVMATQRPALESHHVLAHVLAEELGVAPDPLELPHLAEPLLFGPLVPPRYRLSGPGAQGEAEARFLAQVASSPRARVDPADIAALREYGLGALAELVERPHS